MKNIYQGEMWFLGWKADHKGNRTVTFELPDDDALECFKGMTAKKGKMAGQVLMAALVDPEGEEDIKTPEEPEKLKGGPLAKLAGMWCHDANFENYIRNVYGKFAKDLTADQFIKKMCDINSKIELDHNEHAANEFHQLRKSFNEWLTNG